MASDSPDALLGVVLQRLLPVLSLFVAYLVLGRAREYWRLRHFKGPSTTGISWFWHSRAVIGGKAHQYYGDVTEKYGTQTIKSFYNANSNPFVKEPSQELHQII
jgi:hypothetical protein